MKYVEMIERANMLSNELVVINKELTFNKKLSHDKIVELSQQQEYKTAYLKYYEDNIIRTVYAEITPVISEILKKYNNKPYGPKTKEKISSELAERTGCHMYISTSYGSDTMSINVGVGHRYYNFDIYPTWDKERGEHNRVLVDNKVQALTADKMQLGYIDSEYIEDIPARIEEVKELAQRAKVLQDELRELCSKYNKLAPSTAKDITYSKFINGSVL